MSGVFAQLDAEELIAAIWRYNSSATLVASDRLLHEAFASPTASLDPDSVAKQVVLLDGVWATRLFMEGGASDRIAASLAASSSELIDQFAALPDDALVRSPELVVKAANVALPVVLHHSAAEKTKFRKNYSFATKFFHWVTRVHFPIVDSRARKEINRLQAAAGIRPRVRSDTAAMNGLTYEEEYSRWIAFYSDLISEIPEAMQEAILRADGDSQPAGLRSENSLLRVLDKAFYVMGGGTGVGRI